MMKREREKNTKIYLTVNKKKITFVIAKSHGNRRRSICENRRRKISTKTFNI
jgi:hypothetical protein